MAWKTTVHVLTHPIHFEGKDYAAITMREPDVDALEAIEELGITEGKNPSIKQVRGIIAALADFSSVVIGKMHRDDLTALSEHLAPLLEGTEAEPAS